MSATEERPATLPEKLLTGDSADAEPQTLESLLKEDRERLEVLRKKIRSFLVSAITLTTVVTSLALLSSLAKRLSQAEIFLDLFSDIASEQHLDAPSPDDIVIETPSFTQSASLIPIGTFWYPSILMSLTAAHIAVGSLLWIRGYDSYGIHRTPTEILAVRKTRYESFNGWFVNHIAKGLFFLLLAAIVLFYIGLIDLFLHLYPLVVAFLA